jgi:histidyl-tRNA synthetase
VGAVSLRFQAVKGARDLLPPESERFAAVEAIAREVFSAYGYGEIRTPILEPTELFARSVGETTDIVHKEMYTFPDRKGRSLTLRPENTAGVVRAVVEAGLERFRFPLRLWYAGPQFRYERPQKGRYREFRQIGAELMGAPGAAAELELLEMLFRFLRALGFERLFVKLNCLLSGPEREEFARALHGHVAKRESELGADDRRRLAENPLRLFDSKDPVTKAILAEAPSPSGYFRESSYPSYLELKDLLKRADIPFVESQDLVRGIDYYTGMVFEIACRGLGAQDAILGGGRYDNLIRDLGGRAVAAVGFAIGEDRLVEVLERDPRGLRAVYLVIPDSPAEFRYALEVAGAVRKLRPESVVETDLSWRGQAFKKGFNPAARFESLHYPFRAEHRFAILLGEKERTSHTITLRNLQLRTQDTFPAGELAERLGVARDS